MPVRAIPLDYPLAGIIRLLIVDDSSIARAIFTRMLDSRPEFSVVASVSSAAMALDVVSREKVDIVLLDLEMPGVGGLEILPQLIERSGGACVLIVSSSASAGAAATVRALALGAADTLQKPGATSFLGRFADTLAERLIRIAASRSLAHSPASAQILGSAPVSRAPIECLAIGASTGGIVALTEVLRALPPRFSAPILITQHLPATFIPYFADQIGQATGRRTRIVRDGEKLVAGDVLIASGEGHIRLARGRGGVYVRVDPTAATTNCMPSVDPMFQTLAEVYGACGLGVVLSGMGRDGTVGARALAQSGGEVLVQNPETSVVWGMPGSIAQAGLASAVLSPARIAAYILARLDACPWS